MLPAYIGAWGGNLLPRGGILGGILHPGNRFGSFRITLRASHERQGDAAMNRTIKGYELRARVGAGGFGEVYRAYQPSVGREVAIKVILPQHANQPDFIRRFEVEAQLVARLEHPHIVPIYDYWRDPDGA